MNYSKDAYNGEEARSCHLKTIEYKRPNIEELKEKFTAALEKFDNAKTVEEQKQVIHSINEIRNDFGTMGNLCYIRHSVDTTDAFL